VCGCAQAFGPALAGRHLQKDYGKGRNFFVHKRENFSACGLTNRRKSNKLFALKLHGESA